MYSVNYIKHDASYNWGLWFDHQDQPPVGWVVYVSSNGDVSWMMIW